MSSILAVMNDMADAMTAVNASRRQIRGVATWRDLVAASVAAGGKAAAPEAGPHAAAGYADRVAGPLPGSGTHRRWMDTAEAIITTLNHHAAHAEEMAREWREGTAELREEEKKLRARQAEAEAAGLYEAAAEYADMAASAARDARRAERRTAAWEEWAVAAADAGAYGARLTAGEDAIHQPVGLAVADAGGRAWIADDKHFLTGGA